MKRALFILAIVGLLFCSGCRSKDPFRNYSIKFSNFSSGEISTIEAIENELTYTPITDSSASDVTLVHFTNTVKKGRKAELAIKAAPNTFYSIQVTYSSGVSKSKFLAPQTSDKNGYVAWRWTVGAKTKAGDYPVEIFLKDKQLIKTTLTVTDK